MRKNILFFKYRLTKLLFIALIITCMTSVTACTGIVTKDNSSASSESTGNEDDDGDDVEKEAEDSTDDEEEDVETVSIFEVEAEYSDEELSFDYEEDASIELNDEGCTSDSDNVEIKDGKITITAGGTYVISGTLSDGILIVDTEEDEPVRLVLNDASITSKDSCAIYIKNAEYVIITCPKGTNNYLEDAEEYTADEVEITEENGETKVKPCAVIYSKEDLSINGEGTLTVVSNYKNGIQSKDNLKIISATVKVTAVNNGIVGKDSVVLKDANITVDAGNHGIKSTNDGKQGKGYMFIEGGTIKITAVEDGIHVSTCFRMDSGTVVIDAGDDGIHADLAITVNGGTIKVTDSYEGIEAAVITINDGNIDVRASDDGFNAAGSTVLNEDSEASEENSNDSSDSSDSSDGAQNSSKNSGGFGGGFGGMMDVEEGCELNINGGKIYVNADGDGLDSNDTITITGGEVYVDGPTNNGNGALDSGTSITVTGGTLVAVGSMGMAEAPDDSSTQYSVNAGLTTSYSAGTTLTITDSSGNVIFEYTPNKKYQSVVFSSPELKEGETYTISVDGTEDTTFTVSEMTVTAGTASGNSSGFGGGRGMKDGSR